MINVTRFNGSKIYVNADLIQTIEGTPDTVITLTNNVKIVVKERPEMVVDMVIQYQRLIHHPQFSATSGD